MTKDKFKETERLYNLINKLEYINQRIEEIDGRINIDTANILIKFDNQPVDVSKSFGNRILLNFIKEKTNLALNEAKAKFEQL